MVKTKSITLFLTGNDAVEMRDALEGKNLEKEASLGKANGLSHANEYVSLLLQ